MKVVVIGASGNVGTAVLRALRAADDVTEVVGLARRVPRRVPPEPYDVASWTAVDVGGDNEAAIVATLAQACEGADAVIHLAWAMQPNHDRERLRRVNVLGARRMLAAARDAGVEHVVVASSIGAYSPGVDDALRPESWPVDGISSCDYSVDKAHVESILDAHEREFPAVTITRLRPALIFQRAAGSEIMRYFVGPAVPPSIFRGLLPVLPWPSGMRLQALHADDVAAAYLAAVRVRVGGAFNVAAHDVLRGEQIAELLAGGKKRDVPTALLRGAIAAGWHSRVVPINPGWIDMADQMVLMSTARAREVLGWSPRHSAFDTVAEVLGGMADGAGTASPPLRPRDRSLV